MGEHRWLTLVSADRPDGPELLLEPDGNPAIDHAARVFKKTLFGAGIPYTSFAVDDIRKESARLKNLGVRFTMEPTVLGSVTAAVFDDTCGNLLQIVQL